MPVPDEPRQSGSFTKAKRPEVAVVGAGIGGLTAALALQRSEFGVRVYEREPGPSEVGAGITLWRNALRVLEALGLGDALRDLGHEPAEGVIGTQSGRILTAMNLDEIPEGIERPVLLTFHRQDLQRLLLDALPQGMVEFSAALDSFEASRDRVQLRFASGATARTDLMIGADGIGSAVRSQLLGGESPRYAGYTCFRGIAPLPHDWNGLGGEFWGDGDRFGVVTIGSGRVYWFAVVTAPPRQRLEQEAIKPYVSQRFAHYAFEIPRLIEATPAEAILHNDIVDRAPLREFTRGRVALLGDAAHPTTPNLGQGAAMAIESATVLSRALNELPDYEAAYRCYERERSPRTTAITNTSLRLGKLAHLDSAVLRWLRNLAFAHAPASLQAREIERLLSYDAMSVPLRGAS